MSKIDTIESISDKLAATSISVVPKRCVYIRNWAFALPQLPISLPARCRQALARHLAIDSELCTNCGACVCACPTSAMSTTAPSATEIVRQARISAERNAAAPHSSASAMPGSGRRHEPRRRAAVPQLSRRILITGMFALKFKRVILFTPSCEGCDVDCEQPYFEEMVRSTRELLDLWKIPGTFATLDEVPPTLVLGKPQTQTHVITSDRREAFEQAGASAVEYAWHAVSSAIGNLTARPPPIRMRRSS